MARRRRHVAALQRQGSGEPQRRSHARVEAGVVAIALAAMEKADDLDLSTLEISSVEPRARPCVAVGVELSRGMRVNVIETERLLLEPLDVSRLEDFVRLTALPDVMRCWVPDGPFTRDRAEQNFAASLERASEWGFGRRWIVAKENGAGLGFTDTKYFGEYCDEVSPDEVEIGWMLTPSAWGRGFATEAGSAVRDEAFGRLELQSIVAEHHPENVASGRIMEKLGMAFERDGVARNGWPFRLYRLTREQWASWR